MPISFLNEEVSRKRHDEESLNTTVECAAVARATCRQVSRLVPGRPQFTTMRCMPATSRDTWRQVARATAAHSTVVFNDTSSCRFLEDISFKKLIGTPIVDGPEQVSVAREERADAILLRASHDGYAERYSVVHQRALRLAADGNRLDGEDLFVPVDSDLLPEGCPTNSPCGSICIPQSRPTSSPTAAA